MSAYHYIDSPLQTLSPWWAQILVNGAAIAFLKRAVRTIVLCASHEIEAFCTVTKSVRQDFPVRVAVIDAEERTLLDHT